MCILGHSLEKIQQMGAKIGLEQRLSTHPGHKGRLFHPKFYHQPSYMVFLQFASKKEHARTFGQIAPSGTVHFILII